MNYNHLIYFQTLARYEHYHKASEELHISQPSLSNAIHQLEEDLGVPLFEKKGRGVRLTSQGTRFLAYVNQALNELQIGTEMLQYEQIQPNAYLRIGLIMSMAYDQFPQWIGAFRKETGRQIFYSCRNDTSDALALHLKAGELDLIISSHIDDPKIQFIPLIRRQLILLVPAGHRFAGRRSVSIHELDGESFIAHRRGTALHEILADIYRQNHIRVQIVSEADEDRAILGMVRAGLGCGVTAGSSEIYGTGFSAVPITDSGFESYICAGRRARLPLSPAAQAFWDYLVSISMQEQPGTMQ